MVSCRICPRMQCSDVWHTHTHTHTCTHTHTHLESWMQFLPSPLFVLNGSCFCYSKARNWSVVKYELYALSKEGAYSLKCLSLSRKVFFFFSHCVCVCVCFSISWRNNQYCSTFRLRRIGLEHFPRPHPRSEDSRLRGEGSLKPRVPKRWTLSLLSRSPPNKEQRVCTRFPNSWLSSFIRIVHDQALEDDSRRVPCNEMWSPYVTHH